MLEFCLLKLAVSSWIERNTKHATTHFSFVNLGAALATAACGGYIIVTTGLLIAAATGELNGRKTVILPLSFHTFDEKFHLQSNISRTLDVLQPRQLYNSSYFFNGLIVWSLQGVLSLFAGQVSFDTPGVEI